jgi:monoamine oxidase
VSLLNLLFLMRSAGGLTPLMTVENGYQHEQFTGGAQTAANAMAAELGGALVLDCPVRAIAQRDDGVDVRGDAATVSARHAIVAVPPSLAAHIEFDPPLPADRALLLHSAPAGTEIKAMAIYDRPFWRDDGVSGASVVMDDAYEVSLDTSPPTGDVGIMALYAAGPKARTLWTLGADERRRTIVDILRTRFGAQAASPREIVEHNWAEEVWTRGCSMAHFGTGVLTQYGRLLRQPKGRIHWAGTETAGTSWGAIDGAVRSGERAAAELLA